MSEAECDSSVLSCASFVAMAARTDAVTRVLDCKHMHTKLVTQGPTKAATSPEVFKVAMKKDEQKLSPLRAQQQKGNEVFWQGSLVDLDSEAPTTARQENFPLSMRAVALGKEPATQGRPLGFQTSL
eukprot:CAMPEP_0172823032 /NCGR_PEP_ID=MMETSP1075-20121228/17036_1 /TAXON_ID=2916 /ORGANISM="Ceratium fusus, Strain PA161109" /LENGTH=126 /DNA_ID=CAMNT_0013664097 /DNA_START=1163 /DNA_END=1538 /DNA_ORIENTATION=-